MLEVNRRASDLFISRFLVEVVDVLQRLLRHRKVSGRLLRERYLRHRQARLLRERTGLPERPVCRGLVTVEVVERPLSEVVIVGRLGVEWLPLLGRGQRLGEGRPLGRRGEGPVLEVAGRAELVELGRLGEGGEGARVGREGGARGAVLEGRRGVLGEHHGRLGRGLLVTLWVRLLGLLLLRAEGDVYALGPDERLGLGSDDGSYRGRGLRRYCYVL